MNRTIFLNINKTNSAQNTTDLIQQISSSEIKYQHNHTIYSNVEINIQQLQNNINTYCQSANNLSEQQICDMFRDLRVLSGHQVDNYNKLVISNEQMEQLFHTYFLDSINVVLNGSIQLLQHFVCFVFNIKEYLCKNFQSCITNYGQQFNQMYSCLCKQESVNQYQEIYDDFIDLLIALCDFLQHDELLEFIQSFNVNDIVYNSSEYQLICGNFGQLFIKVCQKFLVSNELVEVTFERCCIFVKNKIISIVNNENIQQIMVGKNLKVLISMIYFTENTIPLIQLEQNQQYGEMIIELNQFIQAVIDVKVFQNLQLHELLKNTSQTLITEDIQLLTQYIQLLDELSQIQCFKVKQIISVDYLNKMFQFVIIYIKHAIHKQNLFEMLLGVAISFDISGISANFCQMLKQSINPLVLEQIYKYLLVNYNDISDELFVVIRDYQLHDDKYNENQQITTYFIQDFADITEETNSLMMKYFQELF